MDPGNPPLPENSKEMMERRIMGQMNDSARLDPLVSVVVPVYNVESYLRRCLYSICAQTYRNLEILLIDDGSTDSSGDICDEFSGRDPRIKVFHQKNTGLSGARNRGIDEAAGTYLAFVDSDDYVSPEFIEVMVATALNTGSEIVQVYVLDVVTEPDQEAPVAIPKEALKSENVVTLSGREMCLSLLDTVYADCGVVWNKLYKAELFADLRFPIGKLHEDDFLVYKLYWGVHTVAIYESQLYFYQLKRPGSIMNKQYSLKRLDAVKARKEQYEFFSDTGDMELCEKAKAEYIRGIANQIKLLKKSNIENKKEIISLLYKSSAPVFKECQLSKHISLRTKAGLLVKMLSALAA